MTSPDVVGEFTPQELRGFDLAIASEDMSCVFRGVISATDDEYKRRLGAYLDAFEAYCFPDDEPMDDFQAVDNIVVQVNALVNVSPSYDDVTTRLLRHLQADEALAQGERALPVAACHTIVDILETHRPIALPVS